jgi:hypothetical protein
MSNPIYIGLVRAGKELHAGEHPAIIDQAVWKAVQAKLATASRRAGTKTSLRNPLAGKLFAEGQRLTLSYASKRGQRYRYYVTHVGEAGASASRDRWRLNADALEAAILRAVDQWIATLGSSALMLNESVTARGLAVVEDALRALARDDARMPNAQRLRRWADLVDRIDIAEDGMSIAFAAASLLPDIDPSLLAAECIIRSEVAFGRRGHGLRMIVGETRRDAAPNDTALTLVKRAIEWRDRWFSDRATTLSQIAKDGGDDVGDVSRHLRLAFLAPDIVKALFDGSIDLTAERMRRLDELPASWSVQRRLFGL